MDLEKFRRKAARKRKDLETFLQKMDQTVPEELSEIVTEEDAEVWTEVDCTECANCCKTMTPVFTKEDIKRISTHLRMSPKAFYEKWLLKEEDSGSIVNKVQPCQFLVENKCSIYEVRPADCAEFPHHYKRPFDLYNDTFIQNVHRCPATFLLIERLKKRIERDYHW
jgi:Fe-S-cluster containining protein